MERKAYPAFEIIIEINSSNSWTIHEDVKTSVDLLLRGNLVFEQVRQFKLVEKIQIKYQNSSNLLLKNQTRINKSLLQIEDRWLSINKAKFQNSRLSISKPLVIYSYSISNNFLKEVFTKIGLNFYLTNNLEKASLIIGLKKYLRQNFKLKELAKRKKIPIYSFNQISIYQLTKFLTTIS